jgi:hypothetical protein
MLEPVTAIDRYTLTLDTRLAGQFAAAARGLGVTVYAVFCLGWIAAIGEQN